MGTYIIKMPLQNDTRHSHMHFTMPTSLESPGYLWNEVVNLTTRASGPVKKQNNHFFCEIFLITVCVKHRKGGGDLLKTNYTKEKAKFIPWLC